MLSVRSLSSVLAEKLTNITGEKDTTARIAYGLEMVIGESSKIICLLMTAYIFDLLKPTLFLLLAIIPLRVTVGGSHCTSSLRCLITTLLSYIIMAAVSVFLAKTVPLVYLLGFCLISYSLFAFIVDRDGPGDSVNYQNPSQEMVEQVKRKVFVLMSVYIIVILNTFYLAQEGVSLLFLASAAIGGLWQSLMITTYGQRLIAVLDKSLLYAKIK